MEWFTVSRSASGTTKRYFTTQIFRREATKRNAVLYISYRWLDILRLYIVTRPTLKASLKYLSLPNEQYRQIFKKKIAWNVIKLRYFF